MQPIPLSPVMTGDHKFASPQPGAPASSASPGEPPPAMIGRSAYGARSSPVTSGAFVPGRRRGAGDTLRPQFDGGASTGSIDRHGTSARFGRPTAGRPSAFYVNANASASPARDRPPARRRGRKANIPWWESMLADSESREAQLDLKLDKDVVASLAFVSRRDIATARSRSPSPSPGLHSPTLETSPPPDTSSPPGLRRPNPMPVAETMPRRQQEVFSASQAALTRPSTGMGGAQPASRRTPRTPRPRAMTAGPLSLHMDTTRSSVSRRSRRARPKPGISKEILSAAPVSQALDTCAMFPLLASEAGRRRLLAGVERLC